MKKEEIFVIKPDPLNFKLFLFFSIEIQVLIICIII